MKIIFMVFLGFVFVLLLICLVWYLYNWLEYRRAKHEYLQKKSKNLKKKYEVWLSWFRKGRNVYPLWDEIPDEFQEIAPIEFPDGTPGQKPKEPDYESCPKCREPVSPHATRCPHCTSKIEFETEADKARRRWRK